MVGGYDHLNFLDSTETLVEGDKSWALGAMLPSKRWAPRGVSLPDTVIMIGNDVKRHSFSLTRHSLIKLPISFN